ncbi:DUF2065 domain-containing protein [uncultured Piscinibacter sp.]|uniref:DUF2065 domain-containing protein n=1 Tax=uncultured Piscinibacter sp. TaxID=1131835 RepID=UPI00262594A9|nr:DUF2065 domain-containing protein [uncultured Piscinibacter sp.]
MGSGVWDLLLAACALMLVLEGLLPFFSPAAWRRLFEQATRLSDGQIRFLGLSSMLLGVVLLLLFWG